jgi:xanthine dehydrogenase accessory factor
VESGLTVTRHYGAHGEARQRSVEVFIEVFGSPPRMVIFGAVDFTAALAAAGKLLGYHVVVCDARAVFATRQRFPMADEVVVEWPNRYLDGAAHDLGPRDVVCVLTHDTKFDVPAVLAALRTRVGYIGAMGSRRTHEARWTALLDAGADEAELTARLLSPIGLDIGARTPEETAVAICAEIIANRTGAAVPSLRSRAGPIHAR